MTLDENRNSVTGERDIWPDDVPEFDRTKAMPNAVQTILQHVKRIEKNQDTFAEFILQTKSSLNTAFWVVSGIVAISIVYKYFFA